MPQTVQYWTPALVRALPDDGNRYECIGGTLLVTPAPSLVHQRVVMAVVRALDRYLQTCRVGEVLTSPTDIEIVEGHLVQPDVFVVPGDAVRRPADWGAVTRLLLAVEVLSPSTARHDRGVRRAFYTGSPTDEYWIVDPVHRVIERWRAGAEQPEVHADELVWHPPGALEALHLDVAAMFGMIQGGGSRTTGV